MGLGYCKYHKSNDIKDNLFEFEDDSHIVECPVCHKKMKTSIAVTAYADVLAKYVYRGRFYLFVSSNYDKAYRMFARVLDLDQWNINGYAGRILSLFMMSTLRNPRFDDTEEMIIQAFSVLSKKKNNHQIIVIMFDKLNEYINDYLKNVKKKLMHRIYFYNRECVELYVNRLIQAKKLRTIMLKEVTTLKNKHPDEIVYKNSIEKIESSIKMDELNISSYYITTSGYSYKGIFDKKGELVIIDDGIKQKTNLSTYRPYTLNIKEKGKIYIRDRVFTSFNAQYKFFLSTFIILILFYIGSGAALIESFLIKDLSLMFLIISVFCFLFATGFVIMRLVLFMLMRKRLKSQISN